MQQSATGRTASYGGLSVAFLSARAGYLGPSVRPLSAGGAAATPGGHATPWALSWMPGPLSASWELGALLPTWRPRHALGAFLGCPGICPPPGQPGTLLSHPIERHPAAFPPLLIGPARVSRLDTIPAISHRGIFFTPEGAHGLAHPPPRTFSGWGRWAVGPAPVHASPRIGTQARGRSHRAQMARKIPRCCC